jgi:Na+/H+-dicarboxylate symporter
MTDDQPITIQSFGEICASEPVSLDDLLQVIDVAIRMGISLSWLGKHYDDIVRAARLFRHSQRIVQPKVVHARAATKLHQKAFIETTSQLLQEMDVA